MSAATIITAHTGMNLLRGDSHNAHLASLYNAGRVRSSQVIVYSCFALNASFDMFTVSLKA